MERLTGDDAGVHSPAAAAQRKGRGIGGGAPAGKGRGLGGGTPAGKGRGIGGGTLAGKGRGIGGGTPAGKGRGIGGGTPAGKGRGIGGGTPAGKGRGIGGGTPAGKGRGIGGGTPAGKGRGIGGGTPSGKGRGIGGGTPAGKGRGVGGAGLAPGNGWVRGGAAAAAAAGKGRVIRGAAAAGAGGDAGRVASRGSPKMGVGRGEHSLDGGGDRRSNSAGRLRAPHGRGLDYKILRDLSGNDPYVVAITLSAHPALKEVVGATEMGKNHIEVLCLVLSKAFTSQAGKSTRQHLAGTIKDSGFFRTVLPHYVGGMGSESNVDRMEDYPRHLENILTILSEVLNFFPASSAQAPSMLLTLLKASIHTLRVLGVDIRPQMEERLENIDGLIKHLQVKSREGTLRSNKDTYSLLPTGGEETQEDFRTIPIYPTPEEFQQEQRPFLRPNLTSRCYTSTHLYLDTHFRLMREDFVRPLREGIQQLLQDQMERGASEGGRHAHLRAQQFDDIRVYFDTKLVVPKCTFSGMAYIIKFDVQPFKSVIWENSKRLIYGSLVCLSCDNFQSFLYATVSEREPKSLKKGLVTVAFTEESRWKLARIENDRPFLMIETTAYFEAYRYVLDGLKELEEDNLPFQRYIVECSKDVLAPAYLRWNDSYDLKSVADPEHKCNMKPFHSLAENTWPRKEALGLDESQMRALRMALTKELTIIQGPPGTGKTYVGLKIARALLTNQALWREGGDGAPMLVVCYTNHALDQFLEGIHKFLPEGIVRVGGRSNSEILKRFNLKELSRSPKFKQVLPSSLSRAYGQVYKQVREAERGIQNEVTRLECSLKGILREDALQKFISHRHWNSLHRSKGEGLWARDVKRNYPIMEWLGLNTTILLQRETENANAHPAAEKLESREKLIAIPQEADLIMEERFVEDSVSGRDDRSNEDEEKDVRAVEERMLAMNLDAHEIQAEQSDEGWEIQRFEKKRLKDQIKAELKKTSTMTEMEERAVLDIWSLSTPEKWRLYRSWVARYSEEIRAVIHGSEEEYQNAVERLADVKRHQNIFLLKRATVIGMTTTGAAKFRSVLQSVGPRIVIVEEAAEVLEAHTITTLSKECQHLILIGDHQQLRPSATVYELARNFDLEMSMFERLVKMELPYVRLNYQHRMRPEIACLLTPHIYAELENHPSVFDYENIKGLNTSLFFVEHENLEENIKEGKSHQNQHEAKFVVSLCRYLILQGYKPEQITILTTYTGQLYCLGNLMPASKFAGVKVHVVDKYQGEENDIVLLSLVRSNRQGKAGFLSIANRVCVALSRAKKGLYCIANCAMLGQVKLWGNIFQTLREKDQIGNALTLCCQNHPDRRVKASCAEDFELAPEGGCTKRCEFRLDCGHVCSRLCHPCDPEHKEYLCRKNCQKVSCDLGHQCPLLCFEECPQCAVQVEKVVPRCGHTQVVPCHQDPETFLCQEPCQQLLQCGHPCAALCGEPCTSLCQVKVALRLKCGHGQRDACFYQTHPYEPKCKTPCQKQLQCGHACDGSCGRCFQGRFHSACRHRCERLLICSHKCPEPCPMACPPCRKPCENCCVHSKCMNPCGLPCAPCVEPCAWQCPHQRCSKLCHEPCDRLPCNQPCAKTLRCGHPCIGLCGDKCPGKCRICNRDEVTEIFFGTEDEPEAHFIQLEDCGHLIEYTAMDQYMGMDAGQQAKEGEEVAIKLKECPKCKAPIRKNLRYGTHINSCLAEIETVKVKISGRKADINKQRRALQSRCAENHHLFEFQCQLDSMHITERLAEKNLTAKDLWILENRIEFLISVAKLKKVQREKLPAVQSLTFGERVEEFSEWLNHRRQSFTEQQVFDLQRELQRITSLAELNLRCQEAGVRGRRDTIQSEVQAITAVLEKRGQYTEQDEERVRGAMEALGERLPRMSGLGIGEEERKMIVSALKMPPGHWYKCPNGHVYVITECGGAVESRNCPDCKATIGGGNHSLASGNQVASEMDGAQHPAWSEANNLANFGQLHL
uniref:NFX1-type zinc finger-containing protein 1 isoform X2 n=1 Tax=Gasterosteus aculeatus aculeatus TaxID=481459 RepID=UPI001A97F8E3|nr:NFX1-type zinc finger-containing protein 1 isoform X2 [Gasterosteus aculeatus aculeatus]